MLKMPLMILMKLMVLIRVITKIKEKAGSNATIDIEVMVPLEYLCILWITFEMPLINCRLNLDLNWSNECFILATAVAD